MSRWARENPELMAEIAALPLSRQNEALRAEVAHDRYLDAQEDLERDAVVFCELCDQYVTGPCSGDGSCGVGDV